MGESWLSYNLLMVEDSLADMRLMLEAVRLAGLKEKASILCAHDGYEALDLMEGAHKMGGPLKMILLDLNMPKMNGKELLARIKKDTKFNRIPVFIMTNSDHKADIEDCFRLGADAFFQKPADFMRFVDFFIAVRDSLDAQHKVSAQHVNKRYSELKVAV